MNPLCSLHLCFQNRRAASAPKGTAEKAALAGRTTLAAFGRASSSPGCGAAPDCSRPRANAAIGPEGCSDLVQRDAPEPRLELRVGSELIPARESSEQISSTWKPTRQLEPTPPGRCAVPNFGRRHRHLPTAPKRIWVGFACLAPLDSALADTSLVQANRSGSLGPTLARSAGMANRMLIRM